MEATANATGAATIDCAAALPLRPAAVDPTATRTSQRGRDEVTYDELALATRNGEYEVRVCRAAGPPEEGAATLDSDEEGFARLDYGNRVTVRWESGRTSRMEIADLTLVEPAP